MSKWHKTYIWAWEEPILPPCQKGTTLISDHGRNQSYHHVRRAHHLHLTMGGTNPTTMLERLMDSSLPLGRNLYLENTKLHPKVLKIHSDHFYNRITSGLIISKDNLRASPGPITYEDNLQDHLRLSHLRALLGFYAQTTCLTSYARTPSFERYWSRSQTGDSLLLSASYKKCKLDQSNQIVVFKRNILPPK